MDGVREVDDGGVNGAHAVQRIVFEIVEQFRSFGRPLRFYEVEVKLLSELEKLRLPAEKLEKEKGLLRERLESLGSEKGALEVQLRKMKDCLELSGVFSRLGWPGGMDAEERTAEEIYEKMLSKLMGGNGEDLSEVVGHLRGKVEELERDSWDVGVLRRKMERLEGENADLKMKEDWGSREVEELGRKVKELELELENVELRRKGEEGSRDVGEMKRKMEEWEQENTILRREVEWGLRYAMELREVKEELRKVQGELELANAKLNVEGDSTMENVKLKVKAEGDSTMENVKLKVKAEGDSPDFIESSRKVEMLEADNKDLKTDLEQNVAKLRRITEDTELQYVSLKRKNEAMQSDFDKLAQKNEKLEKKISWWKKNYDGILGYEEGREKHCSDEKLDSLTKNGKACNAENDVGNGKHGEVFGTVMAIENRKNRVHSTALSTGNTTPISGELVVLMDSDDDTTFTGCSAKNKRPLSSSRELKRKSDTVINLTENEDNKNNANDICRRNSWMANNERSYLGLGEKLDRSPGSSGSSFYSSQVFRHSPDLGKDGF